MRFRPLLAACVAAGLPLLAACDQGAEADPSPAAAEADLAAIERSGVTGTVSADHSDDDVTLTLRLEGLEAGEVYPAHIHDGRCAAGGPVEVPLGRLTARDDGTASLTTRVEAGSLSADSPAFVQVHDGTGAAVACADLPGHQGGEGLTERGGGR